MVARTPRGGLNGGFSGEKDPIERDGTMSADTGCASDWKIENVTRAHYTIRSRTVINDHPFNLRVTWKRKTRVLYSAYVCERNFLRFVSVYFGEIRESSNKASMTNFTPSSYIRVSLEIETNSNFSTRECKTSIRGKCEY